MNKRDPLSFKARGLSRILAPCMPEELRHEICTLVRGASPLTLSPSAVRTIQSVGEIYVRRGFLSASEAELSEPVDQRSGQDCQWNLEYGDCTAQGAWIAATFIARTSTGSWRVVIKSGGTPIIEAAYPILGDDKGDTSRPRAVAAAAEARKPATPHVKSGSDEWIRLEQLGRVLRETHQVLGSFLGQQGPVWMRSRVWDSCWRLQQVCTMDLPQLHAELAWDGARDWQSWADNAFERLSAACDGEKSCVPVASLHFTHGSINKVFLHGPAEGSDLETLVEDLRKGRVDPMTHEDMVLDVVRYQDKLYSLNNRRLWALQQHQLMLMSENATILARVRVLPWTSRETLNRFSRAFDSNLDGEPIRCRTVLERAPTDGVVATTLMRAVLATPAAKKAEARREQAMLESQRQTQQQSQQSAAQVAPLDHHGEPTGAMLLLGYETFADWRKAKERVQQIMQLRSGGKPVLANELRLLLDVFRWHPNASTKRVEEVTSVTVGSSEKYSDTPAFWLWRQDGTSEDISVNKCWKKMDASGKVANVDQKREAIMEGETFQGTLEEWFGNYGFVALDRLVLDGGGGTLLSKHQHLYLARADFSPALVNRLAKAPDWPFPKGTQLSFAIFRWKATGKFGCMDVSLLVVPDAA